MRFKASSDLLGRVLVHPIRCRALVILAQREASPSEIARELRLDPSHVAYHVKILLDEELIELIEECPTRGSIEHRYRAVLPPERSDEEYDAMTVEQRNQHSRDIFCFAAAEASHAFRAGSFGKRHDHHISRMPLRVDDAGWDELRDLHGETLRAAYRIKKEATERLEEDGAEGTSVLMLTTFFELPPERVAPRTFKWAEPS